MLFSPVYIEAHPRRSRVFVSRIGLRDAAIASRMNLRDAFPPAIGYSVCKLVTPATPTAPTGTLYLFSFQSLAEPCSPSCSNGTPSISFNFILLRTLSLTTDGYTPLPPTDRGRWVTYSFRINTCKSVSKQTTLTIFGINTYEKHKGWGAIIVNYASDEDAYPERVRRGGRVEGPLF
jgi:hypothetical protein